MAYRLQKTVKRLWLARLVTSSAMNILFLSSHLILFCFNSFYNGWKMYMFCFHLNWSLASLLTWVCALAFLCLAVLTTFVHDYHALPNSPPKNPYHQHTTVIPQWKFFIHILSIIIHMPHDFQQDFNQI